VFTRPVDGTLKIKSNSYVLIEAGKGRAEVPIDNLSHPRREKIKSGNKDVRVLGDLLRSIDILTSKADTLCNDVKTAYVKVQASIRNYKTYVDEDDANNRYDSLTKMKIDGDNDIIQHVFGKLDNKPFWIRTIIQDTDFDFDNVPGYSYIHDGGPDAKFVKREQREDEDKQAYEQHIEAERTDFNNVKDFDKKIKKRRDNRVSHARKLGSDLKALFDAARAWESFDLSTREKWSCYYSDTLRDKIREFDIFKGQGKGLIEKIVEGTVSQDQSFVDFSKEMKMLRRKIVFALINEVNGKDDYAKVFKKIEPLNEPNDYNDNKAWARFVNQIEAPDEAFSKKGTFGKLVRSYLMDGRGSAWIDAISVTNRWRSPEKGRILLSDTAGETLQFDGRTLVKNNNVTGVNTAYAIELKKKVGKA
jgi:hypothetical protein